MPDENQVYYITELDQPNCMGVLVEKLLFTQPKDLLIILETLRRQLLFNELLLSCMKTMCSSAFNVSNTTNSKSNNIESNVNIFEIGLIAPFVLSIIMQHPVMLCYTTSINYIFNSIKKNCYFSTCFFVYLKLKLI